MKTFTYKTVNDLSIKADVWRADDDVVRPAVMFIHGGALIVGGREEVDERIKIALLDAGYLFVSVDYRLAPESYLPDIIEDVEDAYGWILSDGPELFGVDPEGLVVMGGSASGYLALAAGHRCRPRPAGVVSLYGYGDLIGSWLNAPSPHSRHHSATTMSQEEILAVTGGPPVSEERDRSGNGAAFYQQGRQHGTHGLGISGWDPHVEPEAFHPFMPLVNVDADYPATLLIHGTADTNVPFEQSVMMAIALGREGVEHELIQIDGGEHGLDGGPEEQIDDAYKRALRFVERRLPV